MQLSPPALSPYSPIHRILHRFPGQSLSFWVSLTLCPIFKYIKYQNGGSRFHELTMVNGQRYCRTQIHTEEPRPALIASAKGRHQRWKKQQTLQTRPCYFSHFNDDHEVLSIILNKEQTRISGNVVVAINVFQLKSGSVTEPALLELQVKLKKQITPISSFLLYYLMFSVFKYVNTGSRCDPPRPVLSCLVNIHVLMLMSRSLPLS